MATTKKAPAKKAKDAKEVKSLAELHKELATKRQDMIDAKRGHVSGELQNPRVLTATRKEIARLMTAINAAEQSKEGDK